MVTPHKVARDTAETGLMRLTGTLAVILPSLALIQVLANTGDYRQPAVAIAVWLAVLGAAAWLLPRLRTGGLGAGEAAAAVLIAVAAVTVSGAVHRARSGPESVDLAILGTVWLLALVVMSRSARVWIPGAVLVFAVHGVLLIHGSGLNSLSLSELEAAGYVLAVVLIIIFTALRSAMATHAGIAARRASLASKLAAESAAAAAVRQERRSRLAVLEMEALPLLRGIADGTLDPTSGEVRDQCARHAAVLRHSLAGRVPAAGQLASELEPVLRAARERGLLVSVQLIGDPGAVQPHVARAVLAAVDAVLSALPPHQATLTVLESGANVELYLTFGAPLSSMPDLTRCGLDLPAAARWSASVSVAESSGGCLEISWRKHGTG